MGVIMSGVLFGILTGVNMGLLLKEKVEISHRKIIYSFSGTLMLIFVLRLVGSQSLLLVDLGNAGQLVIFLIVSSLFDWLTTVVVKARVL